MRVLVAAAVAILALSPVFAQEFSTGVPELGPNPVLTLDQDRLYATSEFGRRVQAEITADLEALSAENRRIEVALEAEERRLTDERAGMEPADFQELAAEFDTRVTEIRAAQSAKAENISSRADRERARFFSAAFPVLLSLVEESGAVAILNNSAVIFSIRQIDITDIAISRVNQELGAAPLPVDPGPLPIQRPEIEQ